MTKLVALDTETTGLDHRRDEVFEIGVVVLDGANIGDAEFRFRLEPSHTAVRLMHPKAAEVNRYHERIADPEWRWDVPLGNEAAMHDVLAALYHLLDGAHIIGAVPWFDTQFLDQLYRDIDPVTTPRWHYHLIDVESLAVGYLAAQGIFPELPWNSDHLMELLEVTAPEGDERHTALADARWAARVYRKVQSLD